MAPSLATESATRLPTSSKRFRRGHGARRCRAMKVGDKATLLHGPHILTAISFISGHFVHWCLLEKRLSSSSPPQIKMVMLSSTIPPNKSGFHIVHIVQTVQIFHFESLHLPHRPNLPLKTPLGSPRGRPKAGGPEHIIYWYLLYYINISIISIIFHWIILDYIGSIFAPGSWG